MDSTLYHPVATCDIPMPIVEPAREKTTDELPRILRQAAGTRAASRRVLILATLFLAVAALELLLLVRLPNPEPLVVYHNVPRQNLVEPSK